MATAPFSTSITSTQAEPTPGSTTNTTAISGTQAPTGMNLQSMATDGSTWNVDPKTQTVAGQLESTIASDNPLMQQARARALQTMNGRGLTNSSLATSAADSAMYDAAMPIAQANAATYATAAQGNAQKTFDANKYNTDITNAFSDKANQFQYDAAKLGLQTKAATDVAGIEAQYKNLTQGSASATAIVNKMQDSLNALMANKDITDPARREQLTADIKANASDSLNLIGALAGDVDLSSYVTQIGL
jgi:hypothetical protein